MKGILDMTIRDALRSIAGYAAVTAVGLLPAFGYLAWSR